MMELMRGLKDLGLTEAPIFVEENMAAARELEYDSPIRVNSRNMPLIPYTHELILDTERLHIRQYCRTMTLAQGRILYQLWDEWEIWNPRHRGYIVPKCIVAEARRISVHDRRDDWKGLHPTKVRRYEEAWDAVVKAWPGIPIFGARRVAEELVSMKLGSGRYNVDMAVKMYAMKYWTSYQVRLEGKGVSRLDMVAYRKAEEEVERHVAGKLKAVLGRWTRIGVALPLDFFEHHKLVDAPKQHESFEPSRRFS
ncbi:hypothetical protein MBLNU13_g03437t1 [Cladosporium sp. NU13]